MSVDADIAPGDCGIPPMARRVNARVLSGCAAPTYPPVAMTATRIDLDLPEGWSCWFELQQSAEGACSGKAELREGNEPRCVLVIAQQPTREAVIERLKFRADYFVGEWRMRQREGGTPRP